MAPTALERRGGKSKYPAKLVLKPSGGDVGVQGWGCWGLLPARVPGRGGSVGCCCHQPHPGPAAIWFGAAVTWEEPLGGLVAVPSVRGKLGVCLYVRKGSSEDPAPVSQSRGDVL